MANRDTDIDTIEVKLHKPGDKQISHTITRKRRLAKKGFDYNAKLKYGRLEQLCRCLERKIIVIIDLIDDDSISDVVYEEYKKWISMNDQFLEID